MRRMVPQETQVEQREVMPQQGDAPTPDLPKPVDLLGYVEATIRGLFTLVGQLLRTPVVFALAPDKLWAEMYANDQRPARTLRYSAPLTFLVVSGTLSLAATNVMLSRESFTSVPANSKLLYDLVVSALRDLDEKKILLLTTLSADCGAVRLVHRYRHEADGATLL
jgi:hypothetical protein